MGQQGRLIWRRSTNQGTGFRQPQEIWIGGVSVHKDPTLASSGGSSGRLYFGFLGLPTNGQKGTSRIQRLDGTFGIDSEMMQGDRPWLLGIDEKPYVAWPASTSQLGEFLFLKCRKGVEQVVDSILWDETKTAAAALGGGIEFGAQAGFAPGPAQIYFRRYTN
jgi:hypothetical protein